MKQVILKNKHGETLGPYEYCEEVGQVRIGSRSNEHFIPKNILIEVLGYTIEPYEKPRREVWALGDLDGYCYASTTKMNDKQIKFTELREGEIIIDREKLAEAWKAAYSRPHLAVSFKQLCKHLGLEEPTE